MAIEAGQTLLHYRIVEKIGSGGMGQVWKAEDTKLKRLVAIKTLPPWMVDDERLQARFKHEAQAVASLNHPNIVTAHAVEEADGVMFLVMELVEGQSLSQVLRGSITLERFFDLALPLTDAVAAAHGKEILHRDLKPENVMVTEEGAIKVLDFGLAKLLKEPAAPEPAEGPTGEGKTVGSAAYMSPEQAEGNALGPPSDVFSLGILLYRLACGEAPFSGTSSISMISSILKDKPQPATEVDPSLPRHLGRILRRCLEKDPKRRYSSARELHVELELLREEIAESGDAERPKVNWKLRGAVALALIALAAAAVVGWMREAGSGDADPVQVSQQTFLGGAETNPTLSPDGQYLAYEAISNDGDSDIFLQRVDGHNPINLTADSPVYDGAPVFSPDGTRIAFRSSREVGGIYVMGATGEDVRRITDFGFDPAWSPDGTQIAFATEAIDSPMLRYEKSELWVADVETGETRRVQEGDSVQPSWSPNGKRIAFWTAYIDAAKVGERDFGTVRPDGTDRVMIDAPDSVDWRPVWSADGDEIVFASDRGGSMNLWRVAIDEESGELRGEARPVTMPAGWSGPFALSADGSQLAYVVRAEGAHLYGRAFDPAAAAPIGEPFQITGGSLPIFSWDASPDGEWVAFSNSGRQEDLYLVRGDGSELRKITDDLNKDRGVAWVNDQRLIFYSNEGGGYDIWSIRRDGSERHRVTETTGKALWMPHVSADGSQMLTHNADGTFVFEFTEDRLVGESDARRLDLTGRSEANFRGLRWSPDGTQILGTLFDKSLATGVAVYDLKSDSLKSFEAPDGINSMAGDWLPDSARFLATTGDAVWVVDLEAGSWKKLPFEIGPRSSVAGTAKLTRDGRTLHYVRTTTEADVWLARIQEASVDP